MSVKVESVLYVGQRPLLRRHAVEQATRHFSPLRIFTGYSVGLKWLVLASKLAPWGLHCASDRQGWRECRKCRSNFRPWRRGCGRAITLCPPCVAPCCKLIPSGNSVVGTMQQQGLPYSNVTCHGRHVPSAPWMGLKRVEGGNPAAVSLFCRSRQLAIDEWGNQA